MASDQRSNWCLLVPTVALICLLYAPSLTTRFDFSDDAALVHGGTSQGGCASQICEIAARTVHDAKTNGPFRPVYWAYFGLQSQLYGAESGPWRVTRHLVLAASVALFFALLTDIGIGSGAAAGALLIGFAAPGRSAIWYHLSAGEGIVMPFVLIALLAARAAGRSDRSWFWDGVGVLSIALAILTKNVFVAVVPAQILLRVWPDGQALREGLRRYRTPLVLLSLPVLIPILHLFWLWFIHPDPVTYSGKPPSLGQLSWITREVLFRSSGLQYLGAGFLLLLILLWARPEGRRAAAAARLRRPWLLGAMLLAGGIAVYLPFEGHAGRYTVPAAWGVDVLFACAFSCLAALPLPRVRGLIVVLILVGAVLMGGRHVYHQQAFGERCATLWQLTEWLMANAEPGSHVRVLGNAATRGEVTHLRWHLSALRPGHAIAIDRAADGVSEIAPADWLLSRADTTHVEGAEPAITFDLKLEAWAWLPGRLRIGRYRADDNGITVWRRR